MALELALELLDPVGVVRPLSPDDLEGLDDLLDRPVDRQTAIAERPSLETNVSQLNG
jgi:hypothetical protein